MACWHEAPFDKNGNQVAYPGWGTELRPVSEFHDRLEFVRFERGRSAARGVFRRMDGTEVTMFLTDLEKLIPVMTDGVAHGAWEYCKRGTDYGVRQAD